jgi:hypothetical protein
MEVKDMTKRKEQVIIRMISGLVEDVLLFPDEGAVLKYLEETFERPFENAEEATLLLEDFNSARTGVEYVWREPTWKGVEPENVNADYIKTVLLDGVEVEAISKETGDVVPELSNLDALIRGLEGNYKDITLAAEFFKESGSINTPFIVFRIKERRNP